MHHSPFYLLMALVTTSIHIQHIRAGKAEQMRCINRDIQFRIDSIWELDLGVLYVIYTCDG
jgi:hypothetical protein